MAILLQSISDVSAINPLVAFYDIHGGKRAVLFFYFVPDTTQDLKNLQCLLCYNKNFQSHSQCWILAITFKSDKTTTYLNPKLLGRQEYSMVSDSLCC
jgi:hypothetical protein